MWLALLDFKIADDALAKEMSVRFLDLLPTRTILFPYATEILEYLTTRNTFCISSQMVLKKHNTTN